MEIDSFSRTIAGILNPSMLDENVYCRIRAYFLYVFLSNVMYSFVVQAFFFNFFRVVFYQKRALRTCRTYIIAIHIQWIFVCSIYLIFFPLNDYDDFDYFWNTTNAKNIEMATTTSISNC
jgi:hypothetical protein